MERYPAIEEDDAQNWVRSAPGPAQAPQWVFPMEDTYSGFPGEPDIPQGPHVPHVPQAQEDSHVHQIYPPPHQVDPSLQYVHPSMHPGTAADVPSIPNPIPNPNTPSKLKIRLPAKPAAAGSPSSRPSRQSLPPKPQGPSSKFSRYSQHSHNPSYDPGYNTRNTRNAPGYPIPSLHTRDSSGPSGSEYHDSDENSADSPAADFGPDSPVAPKKPVFTKSGRGRVVVQKNYAESEVSEDGSRIQPEEEEEAEMQEAGRFEETGEVEEGEGMEVKREKIEVGATADQLFDDDVEATNVSRFFPPSQAGDGDDGAQDPLLLDDMDADADSEEQMPRRVGSRKRVTELERLVEGGGSNLNGEEDHGTIQPRTRLGSKRLEAEKYARDNPQPVKKGRQTRNSMRRGVDDEGDGGDGDFDPNYDPNSHSTRNTGARASNGRHNGRNRHTSRRKSRLRKGNAKYTANANNANNSDDDAYVDGSSGETSADGEGSLDDVMQTSDLDLDPPPDHPAEPEPEPEPEEEERPYGFRARTKVNYAQPPPLEELAKAPRGYGGRGGRGNDQRERHHGYTKSNKKREGPGWSATGAELSKYIRIPGDDTDSDYATRTPRKPFGANNIAAPLGSGMATGGFLPGDLAAAGTPSNLGKVGDAALADTDPLGVNMNVNFDEIGGLDEHIHSLKEMTLLPLLYPEVFQRFNITPPRGVLFHGPPGTGKTLMARALAASCRSDGKQISFFMRKGADCLSKWVGEAERQLRLLFEEAKASQPSIIFFDEIDGLAPVRSSKQDQIHASIVSTLLALMDGMDGRGQVVIIGATNRPDAVDPALRRPGRFDREFYFGLPTLEAREKILGIMTKKWEGWGEGEVDKEKVRERLRGLAVMTKGYGGADLRALCTEAALNAVQRRYPQIYKSTDRLLLKPETINVGLRDFMISIKRIVPSSARSSSSAASPLPSQFVPLLDSALERVKDTIARVMPMEKRLSALEEAEYEDVGGEEGALEKEMLMQAMQTLRIHRPRVVIYGPAGMGQNYVGAAALHVLEGYHVQSLELGSLMADSTRTVEAAIVQLFVEAKRHQPSVIYVPSLIGWCAAVAETSRSTVRAMLDTLAPTDPILLLAVVDGQFTSLPRDVRAWFGPTKANRIDLDFPSLDQRKAFFEGLINDVCRRPNMYLDGVERKKRVLEELPIAPPLEPKRPTAAELAVQEASDQRTVVLLKYRLGPILTELKRKFRRFCKRASEEYRFDFHVANVAVDVGKGNAQAPPDVSMDVVVDVVDAVEAVHGETMEEGLHQQQQQALLQQQPPELFDMDLERMHDALYRGLYLTPQDFLDDVAKILRNAETRAYDDLERLHRAQALYTSAEVSILEFDPALRMECERMAVRERKRREEHRKNKEKLKEKETEAQQQQNGNTTTRRSARANGVEPELKITDPVQLERRLKRQRSDAGGDPATDSHGSEEPEGDARECKRAKRVVDGVAPPEDDDRDPLNCIGPSPVPSPRPPQDRQHSHSHQHVRFAAIQAESVVTSHAPTPSEQEQGPSSGVLVERKEVALTHVTPKKQGFDSFLLNPVSPSEPGFALLPPTPGSEPTHMANGIPPQPIQDADPSNPFFVPSSMSREPSQTSLMNTDPQSHPQQSVMDLDSVPQSQQSSMKVDGESSSQRPVMDLDASQPGLEQKRPAPQQSSQALMVVERTPTPLPDFHVDQELLSELRRRLCEETISLSVEELEQLRATCLGIVWRHRKEWNRNALLRELLDVVREFSDEVTEASSDMDH